MLFWVLEKVPNTYINLLYMLTHPEQQAEDPDFDTFCDRVIAAQERGSADVMNKHRIKNNKNEKKP